MDNILFIINPVAGGGRTKEIIPLIEETMEKHEKDYQIMLTSRPKEAINIAEDNAHKFKTVVAVGGDGTINEVAKGLIKEKNGTSLGIIPGGTGNDLSRSLNIPSNPKEALEILVKGNKKDIDVGLINDHYFLNIASVGLDAEVVINTEKVKKKIKGKIAYVIGLFKTLFRFKNKEVILEIDGEACKKDIMLIAVGNGKYYGGGMKVVPMASVDDGHFHMCLIKNVGKFKILFLFPSIFRGKHTKYKKYVEVHKAKDIKIKTEKELYLNLDGEVFPIKNEAFFTIVDYKLNIICD